MRTDCFIFVQRNDVTLSLPIISVKAKLERSPGRKRRRIKSGEAKVEHIMLHILLTAADTERAQ